MTEKYTVQQHPIDLIMVEDSADDAELIADALVEAGLTVAVRLVEDGPAFRAALDERRPDAILSDWTLPDFSGRKALAITLERCPDIPFIFISGTISESTALEALREGATDYVFKHQLKCLCPSLLRAIKEAGAERALRESESRLRTLLQTIPDLIWLKDADGVYLSCNRMFERFFGAGEADIVGKTDYDFLNRELADSFRDHDRQAMAVGKPSSKLEWITFADDGRRALMDTLKTPMFDARGELIGVLGIARDITENKKTEEENAKLEAQLQQAQKMESVGQLAGGVAHDFNNMLGVILGHAELAMMRPDLSPPLLADLEEIRKAAERSANLTRQLLAFARKQTIAPQALDLNEAMAGMLKMLQRLIGEDIHLVWQPGVNLWPVKVDPSQIDQILANLCVNARDAIADVGKITIETGNFTSADDSCATYAGYVIGEYVRLAVSDNGCGMDMELLSHIFEPYFSTKEVGKGTGMGLSTVYGVVKQNNGFIDVDSEPEQGTTFTVYLPRHLGKVEQSRTQGAAKPALRGKETILLVEDEPAILELTTEILIISGYTVLAANSPGEAIRLAGEHAGEIHLLMTDVVMPEMNGRDLANKLLSLCPCLKRLFMSGYTSNVIAHHGVLDEGVHFIQKPFSMQRLAAKVREVLDSELRIC